MRSISLARQMSLSKGSLPYTLQVHRRDLSRLQEQLATGRRVNRASDDAGAYAQARRLEVLIDRYDQYERSLTTAQAWVVATQDALDDLAELFTTAQEEGIQAANDSLSDEDRDALAASLENMFQEVLDRLNTRLGEEYLFAGTNTTVRPFEQDFSGTADGAGVTYYGNGGARLRAVGPDLDVGVNLTGQRVLDTGQGFTITEAFQGLIDAIRTHDSAQIQTALDNVITARDHLLDMGTEAGNLANRLDRAGEYLRDARFEFERRRSAHEDADLAETITELQRTQTNLQATLQVMASLNQTTLLDFLR
ncbi:flagellar hook-associated protein FlgL [Rhodocaloribacter litoris]|nr:flagellar hook-associated protein FlgL [Rhodocaloribacter litoris]